MTDRETAPTPDAGVDVEALRGLLAKATPGPWWSAGAWFDADGYPMPIVGHGTTGAEWVARTSHSARGDADLIAAAVNALPALLDEVERLREAVLRLSGAAQSDEQGSPGVPGRFEGSEALTARCSRCGVSRVVNARPNDDIVVCEQCAWACGGRAALENAAAQCHNGAGDPEQEFYDHGVAPWLTERALEWENRIDETKERA